MWYTMIVAAEIVSNSGRPASLVWRKREANRQADGGRVDQPVQAVEQRFVKRNPA